MSTIRNECSVAFNNPAIGKLQFVLRAPCKVPLTYTVTIIESYAVGVPCKGKYTGVFHLGRNVVTARGLLGTPLVCKSGTCETAGLLSTSLLLENG